MDLWNEQRALPDDFLAQHHALVVYDVFHRIMALLLYPPHCSCKDFCPCDSIRAKIILSLNLDLYNRTQEVNEDPEFLFAVRFLLKIPQESYFWKHYTEAYPSWLIREDFNRKEKHFKIVDHLAWTLLRLFKTYELSYEPESRTSINESMTIIFGKTPLKTKRKEGSKKGLGGEHIYNKQFKHYKEVSHFIAALEYLKKTNGQTDTLLFSWNQSNQIEHFLSLAHWFRQQFLRLHTPNTKKKNVFLEEELLPLPAWVKSDGIDILINPFEKKLQEINAPYLEYLNSRAT